MSKEDLKIKPVDQDLTKEDLKKVNGGKPIGACSCISGYCSGDCQDQGLRFDSW